MKKKFILFPLLGILLYVLLSSYSSGPGLTGGLERTGATGITGCTGAGCHAPSATPSTVVAITLLSGSTPVTTYTPGGSYTIRISGTQTSASFILPRFGFQVSAVKTVSGSAVDAGTLSAPSGGHTAFVSGITIVEHSSPVSAASGTGGAGTTYVMNIPWTAPSSGSGCVTLYGVINAVNLNGVPDAGDLWNNTSLVVNETVAAIAGTSGLCVGAATTLSDATPCGSWSSSNTAVASIISGTGVVTGVATGTATISYTAGTGNTATKTVTVFPAPAAISGTATACQGLTTTLSNASGAGTWTSSNTGVATVAGGTGVVTGVANGTSTIDFTLTATGCKTTIPVTINPLPGNISGTQSICVSSSAALSDAGGGTWTSGNTGVATVIAGTGVVTGVSPGTADITYTLSTGCQTIAVVTVNPLPSGITGVSVICPSLTTTLSDATGSGTWTSSSTGVATVAAGTGVVTGISGGTAVITYTAGTGCSATTIVTVSPTPPSITGIASVCSGLTATLSNANTGGTWTSGNTGVATAAAGTGVITGVTTGTAVITYTVPGTGCVTTRTVTVNPLPAAITGTLSACTGLSATLSNTISGGTWTSNNTGIATVGISSGIVTGVAPGTAVITYQLTTGCTATAVFSVNNAPSGITGVASVCSGSTTALTDAGGGTWTSSNTGIATIGVSTGLVTAVGASGSSVITYTFPVTGCKAAITVTVNPVPSPINGISGLCESTSATLSDLTTGGTWSSSDVSVALIGSSTGLTTGLLSGTATITYTRPITGCIATKTITVLPAPSPVTGIAVLCAGATTSLSSTTSGGTWSSGNTAVATVAAGTVNGISSGTAAISYTIGSGCSATRVVTVYPVPVAITGAASVCVGAVISLSDATTGGTWTSANTGAATIDLSTGVLAGVSAGTTTISYTITTTGCASGRTVTVNAVPGAITGSGFICSGSTITLSDAGGGTWTSSNTSVVTAGAGTGIITGIGTGSATITYSLATGCKAFTSVTVSALSPVTGTTSLCAGLTTTLSDGVAGGTWTSSNTSVATIGAASGFLSGSAAGSTIINYTLPSGCTATATVNIVSAPSAITGNGLVCLGSTAALSDAGGGTWASSNAAVARVGLGTGIVTGLGLGTATITYSLGTGCTVTMPVTVNPLPSVITGTGAICAGASATLSDATASGTWSTAATTASVNTAGIVTGLSAGTAIISYTDVSGCSSLTTVTVNPLPAAITGAFGICKATASALSDAGGGTWTSSTASVATIGLSTGVAIGVNTGTSSITYTLPGTGCSAVTTVTVNPAPAAISGTGIVCVGATAATLSDAGGGAWTSSNTNITVDAATGVLTGVNTGTSIITYTLPTGCRVVTTATVNPAPAPIGGTSAVCTGISVLLTDITPSGTWSSSNTAVSSIGLTSGVLTGLSAGTSVIQYTRGNGCQALLTVTINPLPSPVSGSAVLCTGSAVTLSDVITGGTWTSSSTAVATINPATGNVNGVTAGAAKITYTLSTGCSITTIVTVTLPPTAISAPANICVGSAVTFSDAASGGTWTSSNTSVAAAGVSTGIITGLSYGTTTITYQITPGCIAAATITVDTLPAIVTGIATICSGTSTTLSDATPGGTWNSSKTFIATAGAGSGIITGVSGGTTTIKYTLTTGCSSSLSFTVVPAPAAITGAAHICTGLTATLSDVTPGGAWSSGTTAVATAAGGIISGITTGTSVIAYTLPSGCAALVTVTVDPMPAAISGAGSVCAAATISLTDAVPGGTWSSSTAAVAAVSGTGVVSGVAAGTTTITFTLPGGCNATTTVTVNPLPFAGVISGQSYTCSGTPFTLSDAIPGGTWRSDNTSIATIDAAGTVTAVTSGVITVSYSVTNICGTVAATFRDTVYATPAAGTITGADTVCPGYTITLSDLAAGGTWSSSNTSIATVSATGTVTGLTAGNATISYTISTVCGTASAALPVTVRALSFCNEAVQPVPAPDGFRVYPNPTTGSFIVEIPATANGAVITIMDMLGKVIDTRSTDITNKQQVSFNIGKFPPGSYMIKVNAGQTTFRQKIELW